MPVSESASPKKELRVVSRVVGEVETHYMTSREVQISAAIHATFEKSSAPKQIVQFADPDFSAAVARAITDWSLFFEAKNFSAQHTFSQDLQKSIKQVNEFWSKDKNWEKLEVTNSEMEQQVERYLQAKEFIRIKSDASSAPVTETEALAYFNKNRLKFGNLPFDDFRENIKIFLGKQQLDHRIKEWLEVLNRKHKARNYVSG